MHSVADDIETANSHWQRSQCGAYSHVIVPTILVGKWSRGGQRRGQGPAEESTENFVVIHRNKLFFYTHLLVGFLFELFLV